MKNEITKKLFFNKKTGQYSLSVSKKLIRKMKPTIKFGKNLFVKLKYSNFGEGDKENIKW